MAIVRIVSVVSPSVMVAAMLKEIVTVKSASRTLFSSQKMQRASLH